MRKQRRGTLVPLRHEWQLNLANCNSILYSALVKELSPIMKIEQEIKLDFKDVLIRPERSTLASRKEVDLERTFKFKHTHATWTGVPIIAANMDTTGTIEMYKALSQHKMMTALHKHYDPKTLVEHYMAGTDPEEIIRYFNDDSDYGEACSVDDSTPREPYMPHAQRQFVQTMSSKYSFYSMGITNTDMEKFRNLYTHLSNLCYNFSPRNTTGDPHQAHPIRMVCIDVANGYTDAFDTFIKQLRRNYPHLVIMAGNVVTANMTEQLIMSGADIVKVGIGPGSVCTTRKMTGVGYPQLSAIIECASAAHGVGGLVCSDGGCTVPGDLAKAFGAGADFVMLGGMLAGVEESAGELITDEEGNAFKQFYGMSSSTAMQKYAGGVAEYRASEGKTVQVPYKGPVDAVVQDVLGGIRSACTYVGASKLKELSKRTTFIRVSQQINEVFGKS
jgi:GMP reductase